MKRMGRYIGGLLVSILVIVVMFYLRKAGSIEIFQKNNFFITFVVAVAGFFVGYCIVKIFESLKK